MNFKDKLAVFTQIFSNTFLLITLIVKLFKEVLTQNFEGKTTCEI